MWHAEYDEEKEHLMQQYKHRLAVNLDVVFA